MKRKNQIHKRTLILKSVKLLNFYINEKLYNVTLH
jgi:hypothetical protein